ncbi:MAG: hypothetical protein ABJM82_16915 [Shimia thalassica]|uniref:hypothetical protein n=1 Tax=Shimia thalassica TaxID=1715693 RepID=UPI00329A44D7
MPYDLSVPERPDRPEDWLYLALCEALGREPTEADFDDLKQRIRANLIQLDGAS